MVELPNSYFQPQCCRALTDIEWISVCVFSLVQSHNLWHAKLTFQKNEFFEERRSHKFSLLVQDEYIFHTCVCDARSEPARSTMSRRPSGWPLPRTETCSMAWLLDDVLLAAVGSTERALLPRCSSLSTCENVNSVIQINIKFELS